MPGRFVKGAWVETPVPNGIKFIPKTELILSHEDTMCLELDIITNKQGIITGASGKCGKKHEPLEYMDVEPSKEDYRDSLFRLKQINNKYFPWITEQLSNP